MCRTWSGCTWAIGPVGWSGPPNTVYHTRRDAAAARLPQLAQAVAWGLGTCSGHPPCTWVKICIPMTSLNVMPMKSTSSNEANRQPQTKPAAHQCVGDLAGSPVALVHDHGANLERKPRRFRFQVKNPWTGVVTKFWSVKLDNSYLIIDTGGEDPEDWVSESEVERSWIRSMRQFAYEMWCEEAPELMSNKTRNKRKHAENGNPGRKKGAKKKAKKTKPVIQRSTLPSAVSAQTAGRVGVRKQVGKMTTFTKTIILKTVEGLEASPPRELIYLNPGILDWFKTAVLGFGHYRVKRAVITYNGSCSTANEGRLYLLYTNSDQQPSDDVTTWMNYEHSRSGAVYDRTIGMSIPSSTIHALNRWLKIRPGPVGENLQDYDMGYLYIALTGLNTNLVREFGIVTLNLEIECMTQTLPGYGSMPQASARFVQYNLLNLDTNFEEDITPNGGDVIFDNIGVTETAGLAVLPTSDVAELNVSGTCSLGAGQSGYVEILDETDTIVGSQLVSAPAAAAITQPFSLNAIVGFLAATATAFKIRALITGAGTFSVQDMYTTVRLVQQVGQFTGLLGLAGGWMEYSRRVGNPTAAHVLKYYAYRGKRIGLTQGDQKRWMADVQRLGVILPKPVCKNQNALFVSPLEESKNNAPDPSDGDTVPPMMVVCARCRTEKCRGDCAGMKSFS